MQKKTFNCVIVFALYTFLISVALSLENPILKDTEIKAVIASNDSNQIIELNDQIEALWKKEEKQVYFEKKTFFCQELYTNSTLSYDLFEKFLSQILSKNDDIILEQNSIIALRCKTELVFDLISPRPYIKISNEEELAKIRSIHSKILASFIQYVRSEIIPNYQPYKTYLSGPEPPIAPPGQGTHNGMDPKSITNEEARVAYEKAIEEYLAKSYMNKRQRHLKHFLDVELRFINPYFISSYTKKPYRNEELLSYLKLAGYSEAEQTEIMEKVKDRIANPPVLFDFNKQWWEQPDQMGNSNKNEKQP